LCSSIPAVMQQIRSLAGKDHIFDSQWLVTKGNTPGDFGIRNANFLVPAIQDLAIARMDGAIVWPVTDFVPELNFMSADGTQPFCSGILFGWMAQYYEGEALPVRGDLPAAAARSDRGLTVFVASQDAGRRLVTVAIDGMEVTSVTSAEVLFSNQPDDPLLSRIPQVANLPTTLIRESGRPVGVQFVVNPGTPGRGSNWEIARVSLR
jgi:hypothetical protein